MGYTQPIHAGKRNSVMTALASMLAKKLRPSTRQEIERAAKGTGRRSDLSLKRPDWRGGANPCERARCLPAKQPGRIRQSWSSGKARQRKRQQESKGPRHSAAPFHLDNLIWTIRHQGANRQCPPGSAARAFSCPRAASSCRLCDRQSRIYHKFSQRPACEGIDVHGTLPGAPRS